MHACHPQVPAINIPNLVFSSPHLILEPPSTVSGGRLSSWHILHDIFNAMLQKSYLSKHRFAYFMR